MLATQQTEAQDVSIESDRPLQVGDREAYVVGSSQQPTTLFSRALMRREMTAPIPFSTR
jgi:hypothetical protein